MFLHVCGMIRSAPLRLTAEDKLDVLRKLDPASRWESLDDERYCTRCEHVISGRQIEVVGGTRAHGPLRLQCPTDGCAATMSDWTAPDAGNGARAGSSDSGEACDAVAAHDAGFLRIHSQSEGILISHNGRAAVVRRMRSGRVVPLEDVAEWNQPRGQRGRLLAWLAQNIGSVAADARRLLGAIRPTPRARLGPVH